MFNRIIINGYNTLAICGAYNSDIIVRSSDSQGSTTEEELLALSNQGAESRPHSSYYASPPSPVSSRFELALDHSYGKM